jgi:hypothetical protein
LSGQTPQTHTLANNSQPADSYILKYFWNSFYSTSSVVTPSRRLLATAASGACNLHLPWSKTQKGRGDDVWIPHQEAPLDPIHALHKHYIKNKLSINHPIAAYRDKQNNILQNL